MDEDHCSAMHAVVVTPLVAAPARSVSEPLPTGQRLLCAVQRGGGKGPGDADSQRYGARRPRRSCPMPSRDSVGPEIRGRADMVLSTPTPCERGWRSAMAMTPPMGAVEAPEGVLREAGYDVTIEF